VPMRGEVGGGNGGGSIETVPMRGEDGGGSIGI
jgi:hypothetical protein